MVYIQMTFSAVIHIVLFVAKSEVWVFFSFFVSFLLFFIVYFSFLFLFLFFFCSLITITYEGVNPDMP